MEIIIENRKDESPFNLRKQEKIPAIIYGGNKEPTKIMISKKALIKEANRENYYSKVLKLKSGNSNQDVLAKSIQKNPITDQIIHADFMRVDPSQKIRTHVLLKFINKEKSPAIKRGGVLNVIVHALEVKCSPYEIPEELIYDLNGIEMSDHIHLEELKLPKGIMPVHPKRDNVLATIVAPTQEKEEEEQKVEEEEKEKEEKPKE